MKVPDFPNVTQMAVPFFVATMLLEIVVGRLTGKARYETRDTTVSLALGLGSVVIDTAMALVSGVFLFWIWDHRIFELGFSVSVIALCFVVDDLRYYVFHRFSHRSRWGWASHVNHHSSQHFNLSTALRQTWSLTFTGLFILRAPLVILGFHPAVIFFAGGLSLVYQYWIHTELIGRLPGPIEAVMNTPSHHRVHHAVNPRYLDANYAGVFIIWDRMFGTFVPEDAAEPARYGVIKNLGTFNVLVAAFHEWWAMVKDAVRPGISAGQRLRYLFDVPGYSHDGTRVTTEAIKAEHIRLHPDQAGLPGLPSMLARPGPAE